MDPDGLTAQQIYWQSPSDVARSWEQMKGQSIQALDEMVNNHPGLWPLAASLQTAMDIGHGTVDLLKFGEGAAKGSLGGYAMDALRAVGIAGNVAGPVRAVAKDFVRMASNEIGAVGNIEDLVNAKKGIPINGGGTGSAYNKATGQGIYVLRNEAENIQYVGRGDAPTRIAKHATTPGKDDLIGEIIWDNNLTKAQAKGLEQRLIENFGGTKRLNPNTTLQNEIRSYSPNNPNASMYSETVTDELWAETLKRLGL